MFEIRKPTVAGSFYPATASAIKKQLEGFIKPETLKTEAIACMLPHAGYMYSGQVAAETVASVNIKEKIILLGPNHTGYGTAYSIMTKGAWQTPMGEVEIDSGLAQKLLKNSEYLEEDSLAHAYEHSLEVELPILQYLKESFKIVPIAFMSDDLRGLEAVGEEIANTIKAQKDQVLLIASSDMTHFESAEDARKKDDQAIEAILELDEDKLMQRVKKFAISMCGYAPVIVMLKTAKLLGAKKAKLIKYQNSGDITGDKTSVVGYAGVIIY